jgi:hypothetical protein
MRRRPVLRKKGDRGVRYVNDLRLGTGVGSQNRSTNSTVIRGTRFGIKRTMICTCYQQGQAAMNSSDTMVPTSAPVFGGIPSETIVVTLGTRCECFGPCLRFPHDAILTDATGSLIQLFSQHSCPVGGGQVASLSMFRVVVNRGRLYP